MEGLTEGQIVHFNNGDLRHKAAIVIEVVEYQQERGAVQLHVFWLPGDYPTITEMDWIYFGEPHEYGKWHWIEKA